MKINYVFAAFMLLIITSCYVSGGDQRSDNKMEDEAKINALALLKTPIVKKKFDPVKLANGENLYTELCSMCHGSNAEGDPNWKRPDDDGKYPAPPLKGTGHTWHHPMNILRDYIKEGSIEKGGSMTGFKEVLSDEEVDNIIAWFQSKWPDELYSSWYWRDKKSQSK